MLALRSIGTEQCLGAATRLEAISENTSISLHLRNAGLNRSIARTIADAFRSLNQQEASSLLSVSFSFNADLGDDGAAILASALPVSLPELGFVGCAVGDKGGEVLLEWAMSARQRK